MRYIFLLLISMSTLLSQISTQYPEHRLRGDYKFGKIDKKVCFSWGQCYNVQEMRTFIRDTMYLALFNTNPSKAKFIFFYEAVDPLTKIHDLYFKGDKLFIVYDTKRKKNITSWIEYEEKSNDLVLRTRVKEITLDSFLGR